MNATNIKLYWRLQRQTTVRVRMCYLTKSVLRQLEMSIRFLTKNCSQLWRAVFTVHSLHPWQNIWFYEEPVWQPKNLSSLHIHKEELVWELHYCLPWDVLLVQKHSLELGLLSSLLSSPETILRELQPTTVIENRQPLNAWIVWTGDLLCRLFNKKANVSYFGV